MAYNRKNKLKLILDIQEIYMKYSRDKGSSAKWIFENKIKPVYHISRSTFFEYLATNAKKELKDIEEAGKGQIELF